MHEGFSQNLFIAGMLPSAISYHFRFTKSAEIRTCLNILLHSDQGEIFMCSQRIHFGHPRTTSDWDLFNECIETTALLLHQTVVLVAWLLDVCEPISFILCMIIDVTEQWALHLESRLIHLNLVLIKATGVWESTNFCLSFSQSFQWILMETELTRFYLIKTSFFFFLSHLINWYWWERNFCWIFLSILIWKEKVMLSCVWTEKGLMFSKSEQWQMSPNSIFYYQFEWAWYLFWSVVLVNKLLLLHVDLSKVKLWQLNTVLLCFS